jgi:Ca2+-binding RTX toxin-like protein
MVYYQSEYNNLSFPFSTVCYIEVTWKNGSRSTGSGVIVGKNDVLTAAHVIYDANKGGFASIVTIYPGYDSAPIEQPIGSYNSRLMSAYTNFDPNSDGYIASGDLNSSTRSGAEIDLAIIGTDRRIGIDGGVMWLDPTNLGGNYNISGYPGYYNNNPMQATGFAQPDPVDWYIDIGAFEIHPGNSGGPIWYWDSIHGFVAGVVSTGTAAGQVAGSEVWRQLVAWMNGNDYLVNDNGYFINGSGASETLQGSGNGDQINGWGGADIIYGYGGDDIILSSAFYDDGDVVYGGAGADRVFGSGAADYLFGDQGADRIYGDDGDDWLDGGADNDDLTGAGGNDLLFGGPGADKLSGEGGSDAARYDNAYGVYASLTNTSTNTGEALGDTYSSVENLVGSWYADMLEGDAVSNVIVGLGGNDVLIGLDGTDYLVGESGSDRLLGGRGADTLVGGDDTDYAEYSTSTAAVVVYMGWNAANSGDAAGDIFYGIEGVTGSNSNDVLVGDGSFNLLNGGAGNDWLDGGNNIDILSGGSGSDVLIGGQGNDHFTGGASNDIFWINAADLGGNAVDTVYDFVAGTDRFYLSTYVAGWTNFQNANGGALITTYTSWGAGASYIYVSGATASQVQSATFFVL